MRAGELDKRITLYSVAQETDDAGGIVDVETNQGDVWCKVLEPRGNEALQAAQQTAASTVRVKLRWREDVLSTWKFDWGGKRYDIVHVDTSMSRKGELWLTAALRSGA